MRSVIRGGLFVILSEAKDLGVGRSLPPPRDSSVAEFTLSEAEGLLQNDRLGKTVNIVVK